MSDPFANMASFNVTWHDIDGLKHVTSLSLGPQLAPIDPTLPMVMLLHGLVGDIHHMAQPDQSPGFNFDIDAPAPPPPDITDRGWHFYPNLGLWSKGLDPPKTVTGWQTALNRAGFRTFNYAQLDSAGHIARPVRELGFVVREVLKTCRKRLAFVCHSRGGLVFRLFLQQNRGEEGLLSRIAGAVTLHTPHQGSQVADFVGALHNFLQLQEAVAPGLPGFVDSFLGLGNPGIAELSPTSTVLTGLTAAETVPLPVSIPIHTFGGTNPRITKLRLSIFSPISAIAQFHIPPFNWMTIQAKIGVLEQLGAALICPEEGPGGDVLVTDARSHLPGEASHHSNPLNHAAALWAESLFDQVNPILRSFVVSNAVWVRQTVPQVMNPGTPVRVLVTMRNTGSSTWTSGGNHPFRLATVNPEENMTWGLNRRDVPGPIPPGNEVTFDFNVTAPAAPGGYVFQCQMLHEGIEWVGSPSPATVVQVSAPVSSLTIEPNVVAAGQAPTGRVMLIAPPNFGAGQTVTLTSSDPAAIVLQSPSITVPGGQAGLTFPIGTNPVTATRTVTLIAAAGGRTATATLTIQPAQPQAAVTSLVLSQSEVHPRGTFGGTITLASAAPSLGEVVTITSSAPGVISLPATITIPGGASAGMFSATANSVSAPTPVSITATAGGASRTASITVRPLVIYSVPPVGSTSVTGGIGGRII